MVRYLAPRYVYWMLDLDMNMLAAAKTWHSQEDRKQVFITLLSTLSISHKPRSKVQLIPLESSCLGFMPDYFYHYLDVVPSAAMQSCKIVRFVFEELDGEFVKSKIG